MGEHTRLFGLGASPSHARIDLGDELGLGAMAGEVRERGTAVGRQGRGEACKLVECQLQEGSRGGGRLTEQDGTAGKPCVLATAATARRTAVYLYMMMMMMEI